MSMTCSQTIQALPPQHPLPQRLWRDLVQTWADWRAASLQRSRLKVLERLSDATLHDIGLADQVAPRPTLSLLDYERGRW